MSKDASSVLNNAAASIGGQIINLAVALASSVYVARVLGRDQFGVLNWALGLTSMLLAVANSGIDNVIVRDVAQEHKKAATYLASGLLIKGVVAALCCAGIVLYLHIRGYTGVQLAVGYILCSVVWIEGFTTACRSVLVALQQQMVTATIAVIVNILRVGMIIFLVYTGYGVVAVAWITVVAGFLALVGHYIVIWRVTGELGRPQIPVTKHLMKQGSSYLASQVFAGIFDRADYTLLDIYKGVGAVGIYSAAYRIMEIVTMVALNSSIALFPVIAKRRKHGTPESYARALNKATKYLIIFGIPFCAAVFLLSRTLIVTLYSGKYAASATCLSILIWSRIITFGVLPGQQAVQARNAQLWLVPPVILRVVINIGMNLYLIPRYGYIGASIAMVVSDNIYYAGMYLIAFRAEERFGLVDMLAKPLLAAAVMAAVAWIAHPLGAVLSTILAMLAYVLVVHTAGVLDEEDKKVLGSVVEGLGQRLKLRRSSVG